MGGWDMFLGNFVRMAALLGGNRLQGSQLTSYEGGWSWALVLLFTTKQVNQTLESRLQPPSWDRLCRAGQRLAGRGAGSWLTSF